jgi:SAM-dependent methyltransferase
MAQLPGGVSLQLRSAVQKAYSAAAEKPLEKHAFPVGRVLAKQLGYPAELLETLPPISVEAFAGVSNVALFAAIPTGATVLDLGCGAGLDSLIAARRVGGGGRVIGIDFSDSMLARARQAAAELGVDVTFLQGDAEQLLLVRATVDVALVNGIFNLNPARAQIFSELARVVRPGGQVYGAELILREAVSKPGHFTEAEWFA